MVVEPGCPNQCGARAPVAAMWTAGRTKVGSSTPGYGRSWDTAQTSSPSDRTMRPTTAHHTGAKVRRARGGVDTSRHAGVVETRRAVLSDTRARWQPDHEATMNAGRPPAVASLARVRPGMRGASWPAAHGSDTSMTSP